MYSFKAIYNYGLEAKEDNMSKMPFSFFFYLFFVIKVFCNLYTVSYIVF